MHQDGSGRIIRKLGPSKCSISSSSVWLQLKPLPADGLIKPLRDLLSAYSSSISESPAHSCYLCLTRDTLTKIKVRIKVNRQYFCQNWRRLQLDTGQNFQSGLHCAACTHSDMIERLKYSNINKDILNSWTITQRSRSLSLTNTHTLIDVHWHTHKEIQIYLTLAGPGHHCLLWP